MPPLRVAYLSIEVGDYCDDFSFMTYLGLLYNQLLIDANEQLNLVMEITQSPA
ncbi:MAG: hypothetical protein HWQ23_30375 [Nostoc sp. JL33]|uniref:hypothetical protein n=1 Tax=Nostoc sp. JL33 TaxID=2815396 RepID=UPI00260031CD|nr:hypothetical protein [Nostoc sp. JL33]MBN3874420.1 hypothetical protein [Nostoc sp. JL33]